MEFKLTSFNNFTLKELYAVMQLRNEVFIVEQNCAYQDLDGKDNEALHLTGFNNLELICYARLLKPGALYKEAAIGRVVVSAKYRGKNYGLDLMNHAIEDCLNNFHTREIIISAQKYLEKFYTGLGFVSESEVYLEDDIPHIKMRFTSK